MTKQATRLINDGDDGVVDNEDNNDNNNNNNTVLGTAPRSHVYKSGALLLRSMPGPHLFIGPVYYI